MCNNPIYRHNKKGLLRPTPCKRCMGCRNDRREEFTTRLQLDYQEYGFIGSFVTLTYRDSDLVKLLPEGSAVVGSFFQNKPPAGTLYKPHIKDFMDNLNHKVKKRYGKSIKYIACGEYGDEEKRPHYHAIILGLPNTDRQLLLDTWKYGKIDIAPVSHADIRYTLTYMDKQIFGYDYLYDNFGDFEPTFGLFSKGLGSKHYENNKEKYDIQGRFYFSPDNYFQLNPYFKLKYGKINCSKMFPDSVIEYAKINNISDLDSASKEYLRLKEEKIIRSTRAKHKVIHDTQKDDSFNFIT